MANKIGTRSLKIHVKAYEGDVNGKNFYQLITLWDTQDHNDFEENFVRDQFQDTFLNMIVNVEEHTPDRYEVTSDPTVLRKVYPVPEEIADTYDI